MRPPCRDTRPPAIRLPAPPPVNAAPVGGPHGPPTEVGCGADQFGVDWPGGVGRVRQDGTVVTITGRTIVLRPSVP
ncbi:hypothetical protein GCM10009661_10700 [Catellatospora chokoriensis]|uniref:Uncharacterized protein n=1 Tax=Catellatospora chokoriensis TaxID=310353 RepID=A0A8J3KAZ2_9ACTN|nr:hypothetical protein Cch02nite_52530 [Catellatospora chokoriensis]